MDSDHLYISQYLSIYFYFVAVGKAMACEGNRLSDERIGEALITEVIKEELKEVPAEKVPSFPPLIHPVQSDEQKVVEELAKMAKYIGDKLRDDVEFKQLQDAIDGFARVPGCKWDQFKQVSYKVVEDGITWERIIVLFYAAGRLAVKLVKAHLPETVWDIVQWTIAFFKDRLLGWIRNHGGWINSFSELAIAPMRTVSGGQVYAALFFVAGLTLGCLLTWRMHHHQ